MTVREFRSFEEFWPCYVRAHAKKSTRALHFVGTTAALGCLAGGIVTRRRWMIALAPVVGYGTAWASHLVCEKNSPLTFSHPLWALQADLTMWWKMLVGDMDAEVERVLSEDSAPSVVSEPESANESAASAARGVSATSGETVN